MAVSQMFPGNHPSSTSSSSDSIDSARETSLAFQRVALLYQAMPAALIAGLGCAVALVFVNWNVLPHDRLLAWLAYHLLLSIGRYGLARSFASTSPTPSTIRRWDRAFLSRERCWPDSVGATGPLLVFPESSLAHQVFLAFVLGGVSAGASSTLAARFDTFLSFAVPTLAPLILRFFFFSTMSKPCHGHLHAAVSLLMVYTAYRTSNNVRETLQLKYHNAQLVDQLSSQLEFGSRLLLLNVHSEHYRFHDGICPGHHLSNRTRTAGLRSSIRGHPPAGLSRDRNARTSRAGSGASELPPQHGTFYIRQFLRKTPSTYYEFPLVTKTHQTLWVGQNVQLLLRDQESSDSSRDARHLRRETDRRSLALQPGPIPGAV